METLYTLRQIQEHTNLQMDFIRKVHKANKEAFRPHTRRGDKNSLLFTTGGLTLFDNIRQKKEDGATIPEITKYLSQIRHQGTKTQEQTPLNTPAKQEPDSLTEQLIERIEAVYAVAIQAKDQTIAAQKTQIETLQRLLMAPAEEVQKEQARKESEEKAWSERIEKAEVERQAIEQREKELSEKAAQELKEAKAREEAATAKAEKAEKRASLIEELHKTPWHAFKRKKELQRQIDDIKL